MNKNEYLNQAVVKEFASYLSDLINGKEPFEHEYHWYYGKKDIYFDSFLDALHKYEWPFRYTDRFSNEVKTGKSLLENKTCLEGFSRGLVSAISKVNLEACQNYCLMILDWGGVLNQNDEKIMSLGTKLPEYLASCKRLFNSPDITCNGKYKVSVNGESIDVIMNAGFTKIYSLICSNFIIYDGRVGGALGYLETSFYNKTGGAQSKLLSFHYGSARGKQTRNPSVNNFQFSILSAGNVHTRDNLKANWLLSEALENQTSLVGDKAALLRDIECALFMIGYDFPKLKFNEGKDEKHNLKTRTKSKGSTAKASSKMSLATAIFELGQKDGLSRKDILIKFQDEAGLTEAGANTYYQKIKSSI
tara:strand:+ start:184 stop:1266 length:1083 start_codon:yes stop_codon:yes gene_type:complete